MRTNVVLQTITKQEKSIPWITCTKGGSIEKSFTVSRGVMLYCFDCCFCFCVYIQSSQTYQM